MKIKGKNIGVDLESICSMRPSPPPHALIEGNSLISGQWAPPPAPISRAPGPKFVVKEFDTKTEGPIP
jgi:hypothetical protein